jgi:hypothetical protein
MTTTSSLPSSGPIDKWERRMRHFDLIISTRFF